MKFKELEPLPNKEAEAEFLKWLNSWVESQVGYDTALISGSRSEIQVRFTDRELSQMSDMIVDWFFKQYKINVGSKFAVVLNIE